MSSCNNFSAFRLKSMKSLLVFLSIIFVTFFAYSQELDSVSIYFEFDSPKISSKNIQIINGLKSRLSNPEAEIISMSAYCDTVGTVYYNKILAKKRFLHVANSLSLNLQDINQNLVGEEYILTESTKNLPTSEFRKVVIHYKTKKLETIEALEAIVESEKTEATELTDKFVEFLKDSTVTEALIEISILFVPGRSIYLLESEPQLWALFDFLKYNTNISAIIRGHVCCSDDYLLSVKRSEKVYNFVTERGISPKRLSFFGVSNSIPAVIPEITDEDMKRNRRVVVIFKKEE